MIPSQEKKLPRTFYLEHDPVVASKNLLGKTLYTHIDGQLTGGLIVETEAYRGRDDRACHAHLGRHTERTQIMYGPGGYAYVYLCYGVHALFNVVTNVEGLADCVLVRAIEPTVGLEAMSERRKMPATKRPLTAGPGCLTQALGMTKRHYGADLLGEEIWIADEGVSVPEEDVVASPRVGLGEAGEAALWPWRFRIRGNRWTSPAK